MPSYKSLFSRLKETEDKDGAKRAAADLLRLRRQLTKEVPQRTVSETLLLATWNIREFGANRKYGPRLEESIQYIAEIVSRFDVIAIQEVHRKLHDLKRLLDVLGEWWDYIVTDVNEGRSGNEERIAFLYDRRKVRFDHLAGEVTLPGSKDKAWQLARSPYLCSFHSGWRTFAICSVHIYYGDDRPDNPRKVEEIDKLSELLADRATKRSKEGDGEPENMILLGDFNIFNKEGDRTMAALEKHGFILPPGQGEEQVGSSLSGDKYFDQIAFLDPKKLLRATKRAVTPEAEKFQRGVFRFTDSVFGDNQEKGWRKELVAVAKSKKRPAGSVPYKVWRTFQMSDHCPMWIELKMDFTDGYLATAGGFNERKAAGRTGPQTKQKSTKRKVSR